MKQLLTEVRAAVKAETARAQENYGTTYHSAHEAYSVMVEELAEAKDEHDQAQFLQTVLLAALRFNNDDRLLDTAERIRDTATLAACEYIQVAAVAQKMIDTLK